MSLRLLGGAVVVGAVAVALGLDSRPVLGLVAGNGDAPASASPTAGFAPAPSWSQAALLGAGQWLNGPPLRAQDLRGKVVLVNFWTFSCINSLRPLPYLRAWAERYRDRGLVVVGVHAPEFGFEKDPDNVRLAIERQGVTYPVALDDDLAIWRKFGNSGWPGFYVIGPDGRIRDRSVGEGDYARTELLIRRLLGEADAAPAREAPAAPRGEGAQAAPDWTNLRSPETYIGYAKARGFASPGGVTRDVARRYEPPPALAPNQWSLSGAWTVGAEFATLGAAPGAIRARFHARDLHLVLGAAADGRPVRFRVSIDGAAPGADHGADVDAEGRGVVEEDRLYQLVRQTGPVRDRIFEIEFSAPGPRAYAFTFG